MTYSDKLSALVHAVPALKQINLVVFDVDGVLTDGSLHYQAQGETTKVFSVKDGVGLKLLDDMGFKVAVITAKDSAMVRQRMHDLGITHYFPGTKDKLMLLKTFSEEQGVALDHCAYVGDDMVDLAAMALVGASIAPKDAYPLVQEVADVVLDVPGGKGVARAVCDVLLMAQNKFDQAYKLASLPQFERQR